MAYAFLLPFVIVAVVLFQLRNVGRRPKDYPPGPPTLPLIGNLHQIPSKNPHHQYKKWAEEYGPVYSLILGTKVLVVLSSDQAIKDLLDKRSSIYSSRPDLYLANIVSGHLRVLLMQYGDQWRMVRKMMHSILHINAAKGYVPYQDLENKQMLSGFLEKPEQFISHIRRFTNSITTQMVFGFRTTSIHDEKLKKLYHGVEKWSEVVGSSTAAVLDVYPLLRQLPDFMLPMRRYAQELHREEYQLYVGHWMDAKNRILQGTSKPCFCVGVAEGQKAYGFSDGLAGYISGSLLEAGSDTTAATLVGFVQAMLIYPSVQKQAQDELDRVCRDRLPTMDDWDSLPYIRTCVKESLRWMPTAIVGIPHAVTQDDWYMGHKIPKGAGVMWNVWAINMDSKRFTNPRAFDPSRYEGDHQNSSEAAMNGDASKRDHFVFGAGRRLCQGMHIADRSLFLGISRLLWAFNLERAVDANGQEIVPNADDLTQGFLVQPKPFPAKITPRSERHAELVKKEWEDCQVFLDEDKQWREVPKGMVFHSYVAETKA
ncbi:Fumitremorgin C synthase [Cytospora mali]|uniref:Fumitremorgin C synthase n=1 Tax=Cytospora mali TaxID=578113 RepID=A0A194V613_CYTMA|nr:Fumitremorgin C synthase [Valsa mali var. pyri (nom. inval.)]